MRRTRLEATCPSQARGPLCLKDSSTAGTPIAPRLPTSSLLGLADLWFAFAIATRTTGATLLLRHVDSGSWRSIQDVPNLSRSIAKRLAKAVFSIFMKISPPSASRA